MIMKNLFILRFVYNTAWTSISKEEQRTIVAIKVWCSQDKSDG